MRIVEKIGLSLLGYFDSEVAHSLALKGLKFGFGPRGGVYSSSRLATKLGPLELANPLGLAAGFDKNAVALDALSRSAFGFIEVGAVTPLPQPGNPKPRLFRLAEDRAAINRFGFNNEGMEAVVTRLRNRPEDMILGLNLGANKTSADRAADYARVLVHCGPYIDFATVNVSSPNTESLRDLQGKEALTELLRGVENANVAGVPVFLKIAPDLSDEEIADIADVANDSDLTGIIATNTTLSRDGLRSSYAGEAGGLSGQPLFEKSTRVLALLSTLTDLPLIGVGGIGSAEQAYAKIRAGASALQLYTALVYGGLSLANDILEGLDRLLARDGFASIADAVGTDKDRWL